MGTFATILAAIAWDPEIRNILSVLVGVSVLIGSVYIIIASNTGVRSGVLIVFTALFGWMMTMGAVWWIYGIGMKGTAASWKPEELNYSGVDYSGLDAATLDVAHSLDVLADLPTAQDLLEDNPDLAQQILPPELFKEGADPVERDARIATITIGQIIEVDPELAPQYDDALGGWRLLAVSDRQRGDAAASSDAFLGPDGRGLFAASSDYLVRDVFSIGGKPLRDDDSIVGRVGHKLASIIKWHHPTHYAAVQIQAVIPQETVPGQAPPPPKLDESAPIITVVLERDLGDLRFPAAMTTLGSGLLFALFASMLHRRDALVTKHRSAVA